MAGATGTAGICQSAARTEATTRPRTAVAEGSREPSRPSMTGTRRRSPGRAVRQPGPGVAEEVVQETFLALWNRASCTIRPRILASWLLAIARNRAIDRVRAAARRMPAAPFASLAADQPDQASAVEWLVSSGDIVGAGAPEPALSWRSPPGRRTRTSCPFDRRSRRARTRGDPPCLSRRTVPVRDRGEAGRADGDRQDAIPARPAPAAGDARGRRRGRGAGPAVLRGAGRLSRDAAADARAR